MTTVPAPAARPCNRRQLIVAAAGRAFSERGYHRASMEEIAVGVGISAAALYRHFPNKYALFSECANDMVDGLVAALDAVPSGAPLSDLLAAVTRVMVAHRASGGVYRWEARYLNPRRPHASQVEVRARSGAGVRGGPARVHVARRGAPRRSGPRSDRVHHDAPHVHRPAPGRRLAAVVRPARGRDRPGGSARSVRLPAQPIARTRSSEILAAAIALFARGGFANVTNGQIAEAVGLVPSALYRHYPGKVDILVAACLQAAGLLAHAVEQSVQQEANAHDAVVALAATYVAYSFEHTALTGVAEAELVSLPADLQRPLILAQREHIAVWEQQVRSARPELGPRQARVLVHAGFGVVVEAGRSLRWRDSDANRDTVTALVVGALGLS